MREFAGFQKSYEKFGFLPLDTPIIEYEEINVLENFFKGLEANILKFAVSGDNDDESFKEEIRKARDE